MTADSHGPPTRFEDHQLVSAVVEVQHAGDFAIKLQRPLDDEGDPVILLELRGFGARRFHFTGHTDRSATFEIAPEYVEPLAEAVQRAAAAARAHGLLNGSRTDGDRAP
jgi:hypothetical protein